MKTVYEQYSCNNCGNSSSILDASKHPDQQLQNSGWVFTYLPDVQLCPACARKVSFEEQIIVIEGKRFKISDWICGNLSKPL